MIDEFSVLNERADLKDAEEEEEEVEVPEMKYPKIGNFIEQGESPCSSRNLEAKKIKIENIAISPILPSEILRESVDLTEFFALKLPDRKMTSKLLSVLAKDLPLSRQFGHLKRVNKSGEILLRQKDENSHNDLDWNLSLSGVGVDEVNVFTVLVPKQLPKTRCQYNWAKQIWPSAFHVDIKMERLLDGSWCKPGRIRDMIARNLKRAEELTKIEDANCGCIITNRNGLLVAEGSDFLKSKNYDQRPLAHAVIISLEIVARSQGAETKNNKNFWTKSEEEILGQFACNSEANHTNAYLCTDMDCYLTHEPCTMCAMALLHSRIARVFYMRKSPEIGALGSKLMLHCQKALNHHFDVFYCRFSPSSAS